MVKTSRKWHYRPATPDDATYISRYLRQSDLDEMLAKHGAFFNPQRIVAHAQRLSPDCEVAIPAPGELPVAIRGAPYKSAMAPHIGVPWLLATPEASRFPREFVREGRAYTQRLLTRYTMLENWVDARHTESIKWLRLLGFEIHPPEPFGAQRLPFHRFTLSGTHGTTPSA